MTVKEEKEKESPLKKNPRLELLSDADLEARLTSLRTRVAQPYRRGFPDPQPAILRGGVLIGNQNHAAAVDNLLSLGVTAVMNCASGGISRLPVDEMEAKGIRYSFTNVRQDHYEYPILHHPKTFQASTHLQKARQLYQQVVLEQKGKILFFCVAGMNRSTCLGIATLMLFGNNPEETLDCAIDECAVQRPFVLENIGFQTQLVQLEAMLKRMPRVKTVGDCLAYPHALPTPAPPPPPHPPSSHDPAGNIPRVEVELLIPGLCTVDVSIPACSTIATVKQCLIHYANRDLLRHFTATPTQQYPPTVAKSWLVLAMFGYDSMYDVPLEVEAIDKNVQLDRIKNMFGLVLHKTPKGDYLVEWTKRCRFALVIFSIYTKRRDPMTNSTDTFQLPWTFLHEERPAAPATFLENNLLTTHLRAWDFVTGQAFASTQPIVFSHASDPRDRRGYMKISTSANRAQQFHAPGEGGILGMGANAIVHRVQLTPTSLPSATKGKPHSRNNSMDVDDIMNDSVLLQESESYDVEDMSQQVGWDAAVKRHFSLDKMLASLETSSEAGLAKRVRFANSLNPGRVLYFYGLGVAMSAQIPDDDDQKAAEPNKYEYKWEAILLARYEEQFSTYTMRRFMEDYMACAANVRPEDPKRADEICKLQENFSLLSVKILLVSLLNAFRDLTLMGVSAFDFNHLNNVLISRDHRKVRLIDIDGNSRGSIDVKYPGDFGRKGGQALEDHVHKPSLDIDLNAVLPTVIQQLLLGKGRGAGFVTNSKSEIWRVTPEKGKQMIHDILKQNFYPRSYGMSESAKIERHLSKVAEWFYATMKKQSPWLNWTNDIYDAMRCIDHFPIA